MFEWHLRSRNARNRMYRSIRANEIYDLLVLKTANEPGFSRHSRPVPDMVEMAGREF